ncbi:organic hydroperoxide resistance protein [Labrys miyagiensis]|uniref:Organic hydroperoxide resistance protein n=1 Tax=Labrys miyagiensis TaxID=346912 RepID=A0ABQ6CH20_9HYPH|nr:organic hydroperoxide resistance protein [Labrys miyagiensis]GLS17601.1 organic hydroperoxide resistance protein [Labrys miyagiensis]
MTSYTTSGSTKGGREGRAVLDNGGLALAMAFPKELGGDGAGHNPEQLFALGYSACYGQAIVALGRKHGLDGGAAKITCAVTLTKDDISFALSVELKVHIPGADLEKVKALVEEAHQICPYSRATRNNVPVTLTVV